jgi:hypothetical protein
MLGNVFRNQTEESISNVDSFAQEHLVFDKLLLYQNMAA